MAFRVVLDANVPVPIVLCDVLLTCAEHATFEPLWSEQILEETRSALVQKLGIAPERAASRIEAMRDHFSNAMVAGHEGLTPVMPVAPKDGHVAAAAVVGRAELIVTRNLRDFPSEALAGLGLAARGPDEFLLDQLDLYPWVARHIAKRAESYADPVITLSAFADFLARGGAPSAASRLLSLVQ